MKIYIDKNGNLFGESAYEVGMTPCEVKEDGGRYVKYNLDGTPDLVAEQEVIDASLALEVKQQKLLALSELTVTTANGNTFDGDDTARSDMMAAIQASEILGITSSNWKLADNSWKLIELAELKEALALAIQAKGNILGS